MDNSNTRHQRRIDELAGPLGTGTVRRDLYSGLFRYQIRCNTCWTDQRRWKRWSTRVGYEPNDGWTYDEVVEAWKRHLLAKHAAQADSDYTGTEEQI